MTTKTEKPDIIPLEVLLGNPEKVQPQLSPDGERMAYIAPVNDVLNVWVGDVGKNNYQPVTKDIDRGVRAYGWAHDNIHLVYIQDQGGDENWRIYSVNLDTGDIRDLTPFEEVQAQFVATPKQFPNDILIALNKENPQAHDVYHLDLAKGELELVAKNPGNVLAWSADRELKLRGRTAATPEGGFDFQVRQDEDSDWETVVEWGPDDALFSGAVGFDASGGSVYLRDSRDFNSARFVKLDLSSGQTEVLAEDPTYDVAEVVLNPDTYEPEAVAYLKEKLVWEPLADDFREDFEAIRQIRDGDISIINRNHADDTWLVAFNTDDGPVYYYAFDRKTKKPTLLFNHRPELEKYTLTKVNPVSFTSRDGLTVNGYLALPPESDGKNLPLVLNVHGGPWARDNWEFHPEVQWLTNRGYACLQVNYRGSVGYGKEFLNAGDREWGGKMHDDLIDAVNWAVEEGIADRERVAIYGGSYGGYATLVGATFTPDVFRCAVSIVGPSNLITFITTIPPYWEPMRAMFYRRIGDPVKDKEFLESRSPLSKVDQIKVPMLIAHGANDPRVKQAESEQIVAAMKDKGIDHEYMLFPDEGHGFAKPENRLKFYRAADKFLAKHLGGRAEE